ncbi:hypothetical protein GWK47_040827 [Chionoecetes opilio]|uniref:Uncharacterized protein n=1 Tax=Chionoecetes opilio TaxID=41210 RepID=A0A8J4YIU4_CHIOP|nr:hypothetical protein GWK47_040827 [Chionoecetes opilio]
MAHVKMAQVIMAQVIMAQVIMAQVIMAQVIMAQVIMAQVIMAQQARKAGDLVGPEILTERLTCFAVLLPTTTQLQVVFGSRLSATHNPPVFIFSLCGERTPGCSPPVSVRVTPMHELYQNVVTEKKKSVCAIHRVEQRITSMSLPPSPTPPHKTFLQSIVMKGESVWWRRTGLAVASLTVALGPTVFLIVAFNYEAFSHSTALILVSVSTFCTLAAYFISQTMFRSTRLATLTQGKETSSVRGGTIPFVHSENNTGSVLQSWVTVCSSHG